VLFFIVSLGEVGFSFSLPNEENPNIEAIGRRRARKERTSSATVAT